MLRMASVGLGFTPALAVWSTVSSDKSLRLSRPQFSHLCNGFNDISFYNCLKKLFFPKLTRGYVSIDWGWGWGEKH